MKTTVIEIKTKQLQFPVIAKNLETDLIVLFISEKEGIIVGKQPNKPIISSYPLYYKTTDWINCNEKTVWIPLNKIELEFKSNSKEYPKVIKNIVTDDIGILINPILYIRLTGENMGNIAYDNGKNTWKTLNSVKIKFTDDKNF